MRQKARREEEEHTEVSFWRGVRAVTSNLTFGLSRGSYCKQREANLTNSVPSSFEKWLSKHESISNRKFLPRIRSSACGIILPISLWFYILIWRYDHFKPNHVFANLVKFNCKVPTLYRSKIHWTQCHLKLKWKTINESVHDWVGYAFHSEDQAIGCQNCRLHFQGWSFLPNFKHTLGNSINQKKGCN